jgi:uncharacterized membrane protein YgcG
MYLLVVTVLKLILIVFIIYQTDIAIGVSQTFYAFHGLCWNESLSLNGIILNQGSNAFSTGGNTGTGGNWCRTGTGSNTGSSGIGGALQ